MLVEPAVDEFFRRLLDEPGLLGAELAEFEVRAGGELDHQPSARRNERPKR